MENEASLGLLPIRERSLYACKLQKADFMNDYSDVPMLLRVLAAMVSTRRVWRKECLDESRRTKNEPQTAGLQTGWVRVAESGPFRLALAQYLPHYGCSCGSSWRWSHGSRVFVYFAGEPAGPGHNEQQTDAAFVASFVVLV